ncbi:MAG: hypothetical protein WDM81_07895 [Rhizomicrobium sp.]
MRFRIPLLALLVWTASFEFALAWGQEGHSIVAEIAQRRLSPGGGGGR